jgi:hypothetical protein
MEHEDCMEKQGVVGFAFRISNTASDLCTDSGV